MVRKHFNCGSAAGLPLQTYNSTQLSSHFQKTAVGNEINTQFPNKLSIFSPFTAAVLAASGWYNFNQSRFATYEWGRNSGCLLPNVQCGPSGSEFCDASHLHLIGCSYDYAAVGECSNTDVLMSPCNYWFSTVQNSDCSNPMYNDFWHRAGGQAGSYSMCWLTNYVVSPFTSSRGPGCYLSRCIQGYPQVQIGNIWYSCKNQQPFAPLQTPYGTVFCPDKDQFCNSPGLCPNRCSNRGVCTLNGRCNCYQGFSGESCQFG